MVAESSGIERPKASGRARVDDLRAPVRCAVTLRPQAVARSCPAGTSAAYDDGVSEWWYDNIIEPEKLPIFLSLVAFLVTFTITRLITRMIRAGVGPFRNNVSSSGIHIHHAVPGIILLIVGAFMAIRSPSSPWLEIAAVAVGIGTSLILDEFALILHLDDVYWAREGRVSIELVGLTAACLGLLVLGASPLGVDDLTVGDVTIRLTVMVGLALHGLIILICVLKGKFRSALIGVFIPLVAWVTAVRLARPGTWWARRFYGPKRQAKALARADRFDDRWEPRWHWLSDLIAGAPSRPDPDDAQHSITIEPELPAELPDPRATRESADQPKAAAPDAGAGSASRP